MKTPKYNIWQGNKDEASQHVKEALKSLGVPLNDPNFTTTSNRWVNYISEFMQPFHPEDCLSKVFPLDESTGSDKYRPMVVESWIPFEAICAHHLVPVLGKAHVGYVPHEKVIGLSKIPRLVWGLSHQTPSLQEDVCNAIVDCLMTYVEASGAIAVIQAEHGCMACRGITRAGIVTSTSSVRGVFRDVPQARAEFFELVKNSRRDL